MHSTIAKKKSPEADQTDPATLNQNCTGLSERCVCGIQFTFLTVAWVLSETYSWLYCTRNFRFEWNAQLGRVVSCEARIGQYKSKLGAKTQNSSSEKQIKFAKMPSDSFFGFSILIAGRPVPEYLKDGRVFVESNLWTPFSYNQETEEYVSGERETQKCPVTPYQIMVHLAPHCETSVVFIYVDGVRVTKMILERGQSRYGHHPARNTTATVKYCHSYLNTWVVHYLSLIMLHFSAEWSEVSRTKVA